MRCEFDIVYVGTASGNLLGYRGADGKQVVRRGDRFQYTTELPLKPYPMIWSEKAAPPGMALTGVSWLIRA
ncbi:MAG: hypothetical protein H0X25_19670 [Acidobacteriales bacterium]|nr:hypothetical protein [Terriglobales bacterium]